MHKRIYLNERPKSVPLPNLIELQTSSYNWLFKEGIHELLDEISPVDDFTGKRYRLEFGDYWLEKPKYTEELCKAKNLTYKAPLKVNVILEDKIRRKKNEAKVFLGDFPLMTPRGTFVVNGIERVVVSQIVRSFGVLFVAEDFIDRKLYGAKIIPSRGAWLEFETSNKDVLYVKIDRKRKIPVTTLLKAMGVETNEQIAKLFSRVNNDSDHNYIEETFAKDPAKTYDEALVEVYKRIRPGDLATPETAKSYLDAMFTNPKRYDLGRVGRYKMNRRLNLDISDKPTNRILRVDDLIAVISEMIRLNNDPMAQPDDIDNLKNRRVRAVGELVQGRLRVGFLRMERIIKDRMSMIEDETITASRLINSRPILAVLQEFFASSQLSQFMNQTNPLAELEHKRMLSAIGPGGLSRERAGFEVRDVHSSHYGRVCPIETPEGPNIGLVGYLASYAKVNEYGFIETPYRLVEHKAKHKSKVTNKIVYLDAAAEEKAIIAPSTIPTNKIGLILENKTVARVSGEPAVVAANQIQYVDVSPQQIVSISTSLIPFVEHDDATRASMGSNMERQAVPLVKSESPIIGTGMEADAAHYSGQIITAPFSGKVIKSTNDEIILRPANRRTGEVTYRLLKFVRSNQATCINQKPLVNAGQSVTRGQVIADGSATDQGELALGKNIVVAFMSFRGANYEDAIIISEHLVKDDRYTSIHIEQYSIEVRDTKLGSELITRDIPNVGEEALAHLDENGIVRIGAEVEAGDILVGKISPKGETELSAEEKLLRAIFGEKAKDVKDSSLRLPHGEKGKVIEVKIFSKEAGDELPEGVVQMVEVSVAQLRKISVGDKLAGRHGNKGVISQILPEENMPFLPDGTPVDMILNPLGVISRMNLGQILETHLGWAADYLNLKIASPIFEGVTVAKIKELLKKANLPVDGKVQLCDGKSGEPFDQKTTVGVIYMLKLSHLVDDKMHARSTGPYSMVTQQPLGGKAQFGGQRFGEMEVWALEAYGAAHTLQEMLTIKSDDVIGRSKAYESIIKNEPIQKPSTPASFRVLVRELQSLGLSVEIISKEGRLAPAVPSAPSQVKTSSGKTEITGEKEDELVTELLKGQEKNPPKEKTIKEE